MRGGGRDARAPLLLAVDDRQVLAIEARAFPAPAVTVADQVRELEVARGGQDREERRLADLAALAVPARPRLVRRLGFAAPQPGPVVERLSGRRRDLDVLARRAHLERRQEVGPHLLVGQRASRLASQLRLDRVRHHAADDPLNAVGEARRRTLAVDGHHRLAAPPKPRLVARRQVPRHERRPVDHAVAHREPAPVDLLVDDVLELALGRAELLAFEPVPLNELLEAAVGPHLDQAVWRPLGGSACCVCPGDARLRLLLALRSLFVSFPRTVTLGPPASRSYKRRLKPGPPGFFGAHERRGRAHSGGVATRANDITGAPDDGGFVARPGGFPAPR